MAKRNTPEYIVHTEGKAEIMLSRPLEISGAKVNVLTMREPTVNDQLASEASTGTDGEKDVNYMANLCMVTPDDIKRLPLKDFQRVKEAFLGFLA